MGAVTGLAGLAGLAGQAGSAISGATGGGGFGMPNWTGGGGPFSPLLGTAGGAGGTGFSRPTQANIQSPVTPEQIAAGQGGVGNSLASQQALVAALQGNTGNLNAVYGQTQGLAGQLAGLNGAGAMDTSRMGTSQMAGDFRGANGLGVQQGALGHLGDVYGQQGALAGQYGDIAAGRGPNPAQAMLNQRTGENVQNQAALMAGQRGAGSNVGLMARQAAMQGAATQQQAVGQGATMQANQQLGALGQLGAQQQAMAGTAGQMAGIGQGMTAQQAALMQALYGQGQGIVGAQQGALGQSAGIAQQQIDNAMGSQNAFTQNNIANSGQNLGAGTAFNQAQVSNQGNVNTGNTALAQTGMQGSQGLIGGLMNGAAAAMAAEGGEVEGPQHSSTQVSGPTAPAIGVLQAPGAQSSFGKFLSGYGAQTAPDAAASANPGAAQLQKGSGALAKALGSKMKGGGASDATPGGYAGGDMSGMGTATMVAGGGPIGNVRAKAPEQRATKPGNDYANDKVPAMLSEGEIVLPRTVAMSANAPEAAARFVAAVKTRKARK